MSILQVNSCSIDQESGEIWTVQTDLQQIYSKSDRLLEPAIPLKVAEKRREEVRMNGASERGIAIPSS